MVQRTDLSRFIEQSRAALIWRKFDWLRLIPLRLRNSRIPPRDQALRPNRRARRSRKQWFNKFTDLTRILQGRFVRSKSASERPFRQRRPFAAPISPPRGGCARNSLAIIRGMLSAAAYCGSFGGRRCGLLAEKRKAPPGGPDGVSWEAPQSLLLRARDQINEKPSPSSSLKRFA